MPGFPSTKTGDWRNPPSRISSRPAIPSPALLGRLLLCAVHFSVPVYLTRKLSTHEILVRPWRTAPGLNTAGTRAISTSAKAHSGGPAARCKPKVMDERSRASVSGPLMERAPPGHHIRTRSISSRPAPKARWPPDHEPPARPFSISFSDSQTGGKAVLAFGISLSRQRSP